MRYFRTSIFLICTGQATVTEQIKASTEIGKAHYLDVISVRSGHR